MPEFTKTDSSFVMLPPGTSSTAAHIGVENASEPIAPVVQQGGCALTASPIILCGLKMAIEYCQSVNQCEGGGLDHRACTSFFVMFL